ncbi:cobaltochelatase subunit CobN [Labrys wisconsinensis]|uniref:Cobaltochelatase CobN n=1 Tax=Labrys wisconsinensis TaxID=425677 RepID=A0ABU0JDU7_9HYPH|nr:cobaltochelatase subunit CobN [Labrys wisconsinensis]MDQ0472462.1 cobaltochelatase CobN [Labrys wisconsinensis]
MHLLPQDKRSLDTAEAAVDLGQTPGDVVFLSFTDSDLALATLSGVEGLRVAPLARLRHPLSVDLYLDGVCRHARAILVRLLGGVDYWRYGAEELGALARRHGIALALVPGDERADPRLVELSTVPPADLDRLAACWREGGRGNAQASLRHIARLGGLERGEALPPAALPRYGVYDLPDRQGAAPVGASGAVIVFYRSILLAADTAPIDALARALGARGLAVTALFVGSLKDATTALWIERQLARLRPAVVLNATAFSARRDDGGAALDAAGCPVLQVVTAASSEEAWAASVRGLGATDLAMHVALPELDGRLLAGAISFKAEVEEGGIVRTVHAPHPGRIAAVADKAAAWARLAATPRGERRLALILSNYPGAEGRAAHAVGLDAPASTLAILDRLAAEGYAVSDRPADGEALMRALDGAEASEAGLELEAYRAWLAGRPDSVRAALAAAWGDPAEDIACRDGAFRFAVRACGHVAVAVQPDRGGALDRKADHHSPDRPPRHAYLAFYLWLRERLRLDALIHLGTHGTLEWLPGKAAALSEACFPEVALGPVPVLYPFIVNNPGEAAQAKRRLGAVAIGHMTPPLAAAGLTGTAEAVERLIDEYAGADGLDRRRMAHLRKEIVEIAQDGGLAAECGIAPGTGEEETLARLDAFLCDVKELQIRDGLHVFGRSPPEHGLLLDALARTSGEDRRPALAAALDATGEAEMVGLLAGLDGRFVPPGPAGAPTRGRADVLPTGRNLTTLDPRAVPTRAAAAIGARAAGELVRRYLQDFGQHPRRIVMDLWGSATMRTGGDDIAQALALLGVAPVWDDASNRVGGFEVLPLARLDRPRIDVTLRISGLFRDVFAGQIALIDEAVRAVAALDEDGDWNPLAAARRAGEARPLRIFGAAPAAYGAGIADRLARGAWQSRADLGEDYLTAGGYAYGAGLEGSEAREAFAGRVASADAHLHGQDHAEIDILDDVTFAAFQGGFGAALAALGAKAALYHADLTDPEAPKLRSLAEEVARIVHGRAANPRWIAGMMRHGFAGAAELANAVDSLFAFAATAGVVTDAAFDRIHAAYVEDDAVAAFLDAANPGAARAIRARLAEALRRGLWRPRRNAAARLLDTAEAAP